MWLLHAIDQFKIKSNVMFKSANMHYGFFSSSVWNLKKHVSVRWKSKGKEMAA